ncbi:UDP-N-acetyl-D-mannosaminuronic acid dehydrogenase [Hathewaya proteolytica DSM 3090]|uniref:UDP-N-acetyl-D-mannosaminuronic acid dehydrogenase n=1 Tax=Hathewaya proteolytica DSM 3090 TaxID=1121331 RepID=A0A1M6PIY2_9CLOT|nr:nucleotide sugar dehydrogenase [Hathewaya proteolytica]SHK07898.1 UDP-N-acetyl-D-mannosaminuronic acid dehydrogenase [Hathewaya proteolytica DSM 3090]
MNGFDKLKELKESVEEQYKNVCVFGQGFVGLPLSLSFALRGCNVTGIDVDHNLVMETNCGNTHHTEKFFGIGIKEILNYCIEEKSYIATTDADEAVKQCNNIIVTVGIPVNDGVHNMAYLESATRTIGRNLKKGDLVIIRSTVIPGTTEEFILPILEKESSMVAGKDFYLAYASERIAEGVAFDEFANMNTIVGGVNEKSLEKAMKVLSIVCKADVIPATNIKAVETSKVFENVQRDVNIAMCQEFARFTEELGIDIHEVVSLANTHKRVKLLTPGPGVGGYCIPNAYNYIAPKADEMGISMEILQLCREKNANLPRFIVDKTEEMLNKINKTLGGSKVAVLGLAMKDYSNDDRISPPIDICNLLLERGADVKAFDSIVPTEYDYKVSNQVEALHESDALLILTKQHNMILDDVKLFKKHMQESSVIIDTKGVVNKEEAENLGFLVWKI